MNIMDHLDILLEDEPHTRGDYIDPDQLVIELHNARMRVKDLEYKLISLKTKMIADLSLSLRREYPALNVNLDRNGCKVGYKTKNMIFEPDIEHRKWKVQSSHPRFLGLFNRDFKNYTSLSTDMLLLTKAIGTHFTNYYKTLGESITGTGVLLIEGKSGTLSNILAWKSINSNLDD